MSNIFTRTLLSSMDFPVRNGVTASVDSRLFNISDNNVFQRYFNIDLRDKEVEVPIICRREVQSILTDNMSIRNNNWEGTKPLDYFVHPLYVTWSTRKRTSDSAIRAMFECPTGNMLVKITTSSGAVYYGGAGIIFNSNMECIFLSTVTLVAPDEGLSEPMYELAKSVAHISPNVFVSNGLIEKAIVKKVLPTLIESKVSLNTSSRRMFNTFNKQKDNSYASMVPDIVVHNINERYISSPTAPDMTKFTDEEVNKWLLERVDDTIRNMLI